MMLYISFFFFKQKTAYEMRISDWSSDVCSSDLVARRSSVPQTLLDDQAARITIRIRLIPTAASHNDMRVLPSVKATESSVSMIDPTEIGRASGRERV